MSNGNMQRDSFSERRTWVEGPEHIGRPRLLIKSEDASAVREALQNLAGDGHSQHVVEGLIEALSGQVSSTTIYAIRAQMTTPGTTLLAHRACTGQARVVLSFAGQALTYFDDLERLYEIPASRRIIEACSAAILDELESGARLEGYHPRGIDLVGWLTDQTTRPDDQTLSSGPILLPLIFVTSGSTCCPQAVWLCAGENRRQTVAVMGHSQAS